MSQKQNLINKVLEQIVVDVNTGDLTAIEELIANLDETKLEGFLSENEKPQPVEWR